MAPRPGLCQLCHESRDEELARTYEGIISFHPVFRYGSIDLTSLSRAESIVRIGQTQGENHHVCLLY